MITITNDNVTAIGSRELQCIQLVYLLRHYIEKDPELLNKAIDYITDDQDESFIDMLFHDCYFELTHGWGTNSNYHIRTIYKDYKEAKKILSFVFDLYQEQLENCAGKGPFVCILKTKGVINNGINQETKKRESK